MSAAARHVLVLASAFDAIRDRAKTLAVTRLDDEPTGDCPCGCGKAAYPYSVEGLDGYVDAAPECAQTLAALALEDQA